MPLTGNRRDVLRAIAGSTAAAALSCTRQFIEVNELTLAAIRDGLAAGRFTARALAESYLARIRAIDKAGPAISAVVEINPDALALAGDLDSERKARGPRGPLHGMPVLLKDNIDTADRMVTTAGSLALANSIALRDSAVAARLRAAGAVILGKTNLSEWANFRSTHSSSGWSGCGGQTRNPYALDRNPSGSSSGSAAAVAANLCAVAVGTETDGSVVSPAANCGIVGIKPTLGLIGGAGIVPIAHSQDTAGPMARTVADAALLLGALAGKDYSGALQAGALRGARLGVARNFFGYNREADGVMQTALDALRREGAVLIDPADVPSTDKLSEPEMEVLFYEFKADLNKYLAGLRPNVPVRSLADVIAFNDRNASREMPYFGQEIMLKAQAKGPLTEAAYQQARASCIRLSREEGIDAVMRRHSLDALVAPAGGPAWLTDLVTGDHEIGGSSSPAAIAGYPNITVPAGFARELPVGISFFGAAWSEPKLIGYAYAFEQATRARRAPQFHPTSCLICGNSE